MTYREFVSQLASTAPSHSDLSAVGLRDDLALKIINQHHIQPRESQVEIQFPVHDGVIDLIRNYDVSKLEIGMVSFLDIPVNHGNYLHFAQVESDPMLLSLKGDVLVVDWQQFDHVIWQCAANSGKFFKAMIITSQFLTLNLLDDAIYNDETLATSVAASAAHAAGGTDYLSFYQMLLGV